MSLSRTRIKAVALILLVAGLVSIQSDTAARAPAQQNWTIVSSTLLYAKVYKAGTIASGLAHNHVIRANRWSGQLAFDPSNVAACRLSLQIPVDQLLVDEPWMRQRVGFDETIDASDRQKVRKSMLADDQLDAKNHPLIRIEGSRCVAVNGQPGRFDVELAVTVRGRTKRLTTRLVATQQTDQLLVSGRFRLRHADFGIEPYSAFLGAVANAEPIDFSARVVAKR